MKKLIDYGANVNYQYGIDKDTLLMKACSNSIVNIDMIEFLLQNGADPDMTNIDDYPTLWMTNDINKLELLLQYKANPNIKYDGKTLLSYRCLNYDSYDYEDKFNNLLIKYGCTF
jgi:ankyrin repeat protein